MLLALVAVLTWLATRDLAQMRWIGLLAVAGIPAAFPARHHVAQTLGRYAEVIIVGLAASEVARAADAAGIVSGGIGASAVLPYLAVPMIVAALHTRAFEAAGLLSAAGLTLLLSGWSTIGPDGMRQVGQLGYVAVCAQWLILAAIGTIATGAMQRAVLARGGRGAPPYAEATTT